MRRERRAPIMIRPESLDSTLGLGFDDADVRNVRRKLPKGMRRHLDIFAGGGGATVGAKLAYWEMRMLVDVAAINHNIDAIATQSLNHPTHLNLRTGVDRVNPHSLYRDASLDALVGAPSCTHHANARGSAPVNPQERASMWQIVRYVRALRPIVGWFENVPEVKSFGRCRQKRTKQGVPIFLFNAGTAKKTKWVRRYAPTRYRPKGMNIRTWWAQLDRERGLKPAFEPDPRYKGESYRAILHQLRREGYEVEARDIVCADYGAPTTRKRHFIYIVRKDSGMKLIWPKATHARPDANGNVPPGMAPYVPAYRIINFSVRGQSIFDREKPLKPKTIKRIIEGLKKYGIVPYIVPSKGGDQLRVRPVFTPLHTLTTESRGEAVILPAIHGTDEEPMQPFIVPGFNERPGQAPRTHDVKDPCPAVCATGHTHVTQPFILKYRGTNNGASCHEPAPAITASGTHLGVIEPFLVQTNHGRADDTNASGRTRSVGDAIPAVCGSRGEWAVCSSFLVQSSHGVDQKEKTPHKRRVKSLQDPVPAVTGSRDWGISNVFVLSQQSGGVARPVTEPTPAVASRGAIHLFEAEIMWHAQNPGNGRPTVEIDGKRYPLEIYHRMLDTPELSAAQSFPPYYRFVGTKTSQIKQIGNAVPPLVARALVKAFWTQNENVGIAPEWPEDFAMRMAA